MSEWRLLSKKKELELWNEWWADSKSGRFTSTMRDCDLDDLLPRQEMEKSLVLHLDAALAWIRTAVDRHVSYDCGSLVAEYLRDRDSSYAFRVSWCPGCRDALWHGSMSPGRLDVLVTDTCTIWARLVVYIGYRSCYPSTTLC